MQLVVLHPIVDLGLGQTQDILGGIGGGLTTANIQEIQTGRSLEQSLLITGRITEVAAGVLLDQGSGLGIIFLLADDLLHDLTSFRFEVQAELYSISARKSSKKRKY
jgi:hypothetical protein